MNAIPPDGSVVPDAHAHGTPTTDGVFRLWNVREPDTVVSDGVFFSAGIHPWDAGKYEISAFETLFDSPHCLAVGECGLDRTAEPPLPLQMKVFEAQIAEAPAGTSR